MRTRQLEHAFDEASKLPEDEQKSLARWLLAELESERRWSELFTRSPDALSSLAQEALKERSTGHTEELDPERI